MLFPRLVLVPIQRKHDGLKECVDLAERDEAAERGDVSGFGLEEEEEVRVLLRDQRCRFEQSISRRKMSMHRSVASRTCCRRSSISVSTPSSTSSKCSLTSSRSSSAIRCVRKWTRISLRVCKTRHAKEASSPRRTFWMSSAIRLSRYRTSRSSTKFFLDCAEMRALRSRRRFWAVRSGRRCQSRSSRREDAWRGARRPATIATVFSTGYAHVLALAQPSNPSSPRAPPRRLDGPLPPQRKPKRDSPLAKSSSISVSWSAINDCSAEYRFVLRLFGVAARPDEDEVERWDDIGACAGASSGVNERQRGSRRLNGRAGEVERARREGRGGWGGVRDAQLA